MKRLLMIVSVFFSLIHSAFAQGLDLSPSAQTGPLPFAAYFNGDIDSVSIYNGNVSLDIPLLTLAGRVGIFHHKHQRDPGRIDRPTELFHIRADRNSGAGAHG